MGLRSENRELFRTMTAGCSIISLLELVCTMRSIIIFIKSDCRSVFFDSRFLCDPSA